MNTLDQATTIVIETQRASASLLQRRLRIDYQTAVQLLAELEAAGVVGAWREDRPREVLVRRYLTS